MGIVPFYEFDLQVTPVLLERTMAATVFMGGRDNGPAMTRLEGVVDSRCFAHSALSWRHTNLRFGTRPLQPNGHLSVKEHK